MALPAAFLTALAADAVVPEFWVEIEGIPWAFGMRSRAGSFFSGRDAAYQRSGILPSLIDLPSAVDQEVKPLDGDSSIGSLQLSLLVDDEQGALLGLLSNLGRTDGMLALGPPAWRAGATYAVGDLVRPTAAGTGAGVGLTFRCTSAGTAGGTEPTWPATGTVGDGGAVWTAQDTGYPRSLPANGTAVAALPVTGDVTVLPSSGVVYLGRETIAYTSRTATNGGAAGFLSTCSRARYRLPSHDLYYAHEEGAVLTSYARFLATRRLMLMATLDGTDANRVIRFSGAFDGRASASKGLASVQLTAGSTLAETKITLFGNQLLGKLYAGVADGTGAYEAESEGEPEFETTDVRVVADSRAGPWTELAADTVRYFRIDDEYVRARLDDVDGERVAVITARGLFGTTVEQHVPGAEVKEVMILAKEDASAGPEFTDTNFTAGDSPIDLVLSLLASTGLGTNGTYDVLPAGWGVGVSQARIDFAASIVIRDRWLGGVRHVEIVEEPFEAKAKIAEMLAPHACYVVTRLNDVYVVRRVQPPFPDVTVRQVTHAKLVAIPTWELDLQGVIGRVLWRCDLHPVDQETRQTFIGEIAGPGVEAQEFYAGLFQTLEVEARGQYTGNDLGSGVPSAALATGATEAAYAFIELVKDRYSKPWPTLRLECAYDTLDLECGDLIEVTVLHVPNAAVGVRGLAAERFEILQKTIDDASGTVTFTAIQALYGRRNRLLGPAAIVSAVGSNYVDVNAHDFSASDAQVDASHFGTNDVCSFKTSTLVDRAGPYTVSGVSGNRVTFTGAISSVVAGDVLLLADYASVSASRRARNAYLADDAHTLGATPDPANEYAG